MASVPWRRYREFRHRQREALRASNHPRRRPEPEDQADPLALLLGDETLPGPDAHDDRAGERAREPVPGSPPEEVTARPFGQAGAPLNRHSPFYIGFVGALGALVALGLWQAMSRLTTTITILVVAFFLTLALNPLVEWLIGKELRRSQAVTVVFAGQLAVFALLGWLVMPPVVREGATLLNNAPDYVDAILNSTIVRDLDKNYDLVDRLQQEINDRLTDGSFVSRVFGGVLGAGRLVVNGLFQAFTILILTLYFLATFPRFKQAAFAMVPVTRRPRVTSLSEEIMRRTGAYAIGQAAVATVNALLSYVMMTIVGIPYAAVLAVVVGFLGMIPMVGATLGALIVATVAFFDEPKKAIIAGIYYIVYQQLENYVVAPKIMARTVSVPGSVTVVAALAGGTLLGVLGALLAVPVAAGLLLLYEEVLVPRQRRA